MLFYFLTRQRINVMELHMQSGQNTSSMIHFTEIVHFYKNSILIQKNRHGLSPFDYDALGANMAQHYLYTQVVSILPREIKHTQ